MNTKKIIENYSIAIIVAVMAFIFCVLTNYTYAFADDIVNDDFPAIYDSWGYKHYVVVDNSNTSNDYVKFLIGYNDDTVCTLYTNEKGFQFLRFSCLDGSADVTTWQQKRGKNYWTSLGGTSINENYDFGFAEGCKVVYSDMNINVFGSNSVFFSAPVNLLKTTKRLQNQAKTTVPAFFQQSAKSLVPLVIGFLASLIGLVLLFKVLKKFRVRY